MGGKIHSDFGAYPQFFVDLAAGNLPAVADVDPRYTLIDDGEGNDDHPHADLRAGEAFLGQIYQALTSSPIWANTVLVVTRDEWGGFFEHVVPPRVIAPNKSTRIWSMARRYWDAEFP